MGRDEVGQPETNCGEGVDSDTIAGDPKVVDMQVVALLTSLAEQQGSTLGRTMTMALYHAARQLWELWNDDEEDEKDEPFTGGSCYVEVSEEDVLPSEPPQKESSDVMGMFR